MTALIRLLSSTPFRLTLAYMGAFVVAAALIVGFIAWRANDLLTNKVVETLEAEVTGLREQFQAGGAERLAAVVAQRAGEPGSGLYLLVDTTGRKVAGNLDRVPPEFGGARGGSVFTYVRTAPERRSTASRLAVGVPLPVPGGLMLIVGRDIEDLHRFAGTMGQLGLWSVALLSILGMHARRRRRHSSTTAGRSGWRRQESPRAAGERDGWKLLSSVAEAAPDRNL